MIANGLLINDLDTPDGPSAWRAFSDRVMGGISREQVSVEMIDGRHCVRLRGEVRLENNGGFVQAALPLGADGVPLNARGYTGVRLHVWGNGEEYLVHLRTRDTSLPWQLYRAPFIASPTWQTIDLPFGSFLPERITRPLNTTALTRLGLVAYGRRFSADVAVARVALYR